MSILSVFLYLFVVHKIKKFSLVLGTTSANSSNSSLSLIILYSTSSVLLSPNLLPWSFVLLIGLFILVRSTYCRLRQDSILLLSWKYILPICILLLIIVIIL